jgi:hypothetical protein
MYAKTKRDSRASSFANCKRLAYWWLRNVAPALMQDTSITWRQVVPEARGKGYCVLTVPRPSVHPFFFPTGRNFHLSISYQAVPSRKCPTCPPLVPNIYHYLVFDKPPGLLNPSRVHPMIPILTRTCSVRVPTSFSMSATLSPT